MDLLAIYVGVVVEVAAIVKVWKMNSEREPWDEAMFRTMCWASLVGGWMISGGFLWRLT